MKGKELLESIDFLQNLEINDDDEIEIKLDMSSQVINIDFYVDDIFLRTLATLKISQNTWLQRGRVKQIDIKETTKYEILLTAEEEQKIYNYILENKYK